MASNRILYDAAGKQLGKLVAIATDRLLDSLAEMRRIKLLMDASSSGADWPALAAELGLVDRALTGGGTYTAANQAQDLWTIFSNATGRIDDPAVLEMKRLDQG